MNIIPHSRAGHGSSPVRLTAVNTDKAMLDFRAITLQPTVQRHYSNRLKRAWVQAIALGLATKDRALLRGLLQ
jgi:hypothetical protein